VDGVDTFLANMENDASRQFRFEDCTVANFHKVLCRGGIMMLPGPKKENLANFLGEAAPFAFLARQAGGRASVGRRPVLELSAWYVAVVCCGRVVMSYSVCVCVCD